MEGVVISGESRNPGSHNTKQIRSEGKIPCVVYGKEGYENFTVNPLDVREIVYTPEFKMVEIKVNGNSKKAILKDIQFHPVTDEILHIDFLELYKGHPVKVQIPISFEGTSKGVKDGGRLVKQMRKVPVKALPENLVDTLHVDITELDMGDAIRVKSIQPAEGIQIMAPDNAPVASVQVPRALKALETAEADLGIERDESEEIDEGEEQGEAAEGAEA